MLAALTSCLILSVGPAMNPPGLAGVIVSKLLPRRHSAPRWPDWRGVRFTVQFFDGTEGPRGEVGHPPRLYQGTPCLDWLSTGNQFLQVVHRQGLLYDENVINIRL